MDTIRSLVSKNKRRYKEGGFDLDLTYIYPNIIAMGFPAEKLEGVYRNRVDDVLRFLDTSHKDHYRVYNLCDERKYDAAKFHHRVAMFPFHDHCPPPIELIEPFCRDLDNWLGTHPENIAAIHCKAGKGRTGVMICAYMMHRNRAASAEEALEHYGKTRTRDGKGVTIPSQRRYVEYYGELIRSNLEYKQRALLLSKVKFVTVPHLNNGTFNTYFDILQNRVKLFTSQVYEPSSKDEKELVMHLGNPCMVCGDVCFDFIYRHPKFGSKERLFQCWFNTFFVRQEEIEGGRRYLVLSMKKSELDKANKDKANKIYGGKFQVKFYFEYPIEGNYNSNVTRSQTDSNIGMVAKANGRTQTVVEGGSVGGRTQVNTSITGVARPNGQVGGQYPDVGKLAIASDQGSPSLENTKDRNMVVGRSRTDGNIKAIDQSRTKNGSVPGAHSPHYTGAHGTIVHDSNVTYSQKQGGTSMCANGRVPESYPTRVPSTKAAAESRQPPNSHSVPELGQIQNPTDVNRRDKSGRSMRQVKGVQPGDRKAYLSPEGYAQDSISIGDSDPEDLSDTESEDEWSENEITTV